MQHWVGFAGIPDPSWHTLGYHGLNYNYTIRRTTEIADIYENKEIQ